MRFAGFVHRFNLFLEPAEERHCAELTGELINTGSLPVTVDSTNACDKCAVWSRCRCGSCAVLGSNASMC